MPQRVPRLCHTQLPVRLRSPEPASRSSTEGALVLPCLEPGNSVWKGCRKCFRRYSTAPYCECSSVLHSLPPIMSKQSAVLDMLRAWLFRGSLNEEINPNSRIKPSRDHLRAVSSAANVVHSHVTVFRLVFRRSNQPRNRSLENQFFPWDATVPH